MGCITLFKERCPLTVIIIHAFDSHFISIQYSRIQFYYKERYCIFQTSKVTRKHLSIQQKFSMYYIVSPFYNSRSFFCASFFSNLYLFTPHPRVQVVFEKLWGPKKAIFKTMDVTLKERFLHTFISGFAIPTSTCR